ncbi:N-acetyl-1-D-myo-inositol-2-amino-2-deoxy-alpha-D-glucopyranoside deacetylase [Conyzicola lurida]|uniref:N-acetyl-1-D-myo-inositol-2-amino-2-deoxy-alpha-D-glucopyranoside deacetylase n=1 Tax=Conyzicola lurida TaxID=1172621 RepID=A0A841AL67_9MICO|nr:PIG-L family deacetylase [Conyzicola lurida]MBB5842446.1 N-acetyl-1-D-myo-inositol-2-amino-2-deoxy-alpha-D-glucopyranoside deacetylase [Conyzicola lurida]
MSERTEPTEAPERVLFVHAHPDDESITTGGTIATLVDAGAVVTVLTCTRGEQGEVIPGELQYLLESPDALGVYRETELATAMHALGVADHRFLGEAKARWVDLPPRRYADSGMRWGASGAEARDILDPRSLSAAALADVAADIAAVIADTGATAVVSYDGNGGYGHPDHIRAREAAQRAAEVMGVDFFEIVPDDAGPIVVDVAPVASRKRAALAAHATQLTIDGDEFALSNGVSQPIGSTESFRRVVPETDPPTLPFREQSVATKIFAGALAVVFGALVGALMTAVHQSSVVVGDIAVPWGLVLALVATTGLIVGLRIVTRGRVLPILAALAVIGTTAILASPTIGGSVIVPANTAGYVWTFGPSLLVLLTIAWPNLPQPQATTRGHRTSSK